MTLRQAAQRGDGEVRYLLHAVPQDYAGATVSDPPDDVDVYFGNMFFMDRTTTGSTFHYKPFLPRIITPLNLTQTMFAPGKTGGLIRPTGGTITLSNADGELDYLLNYSWDKKPISLYMLRGISDSDTFGSHFKVFSGYTVGVSATTTTIDIVIRDKLTALDKDFPPNTYGGTGGTDGSANLKGARKPITLGKVYNVPPVLVDEANNIYQVNDGAVTSIDAVYEAGEALTLTTDYTVDATNGRFTLVSTPTGVITADVTNNVSLTNTTGTTTKTNGGGVIVYHLATNYGGLIEDTDIVRNPFVTATYRGDDPNAYEHGAYFSEKTTILDAMNLFLESIGGMFFGYPIYLKVPSFPTTNPSPVIADPITDNEILDIEVLPTEVFAGVGVNVKYKRNYRPLSESELGASPSDRDFMVKEWRSEVRYGLTANTTYGGAYTTPREIEVNSTITNSTNAASEANRVAEFYNRDAKIYRVRMKLNPLYLEIGGDVELRCSRFGLTDGSGNGYPMLVLSKFEDLESNEVTLEVMGSK
jgi:hypothetical protein